MELQLPCAVAATTEYIPVLASSTVADRVLILVRNRPNFTKNPGFGVKKSPPDVSIVGPAGEVPAGGRMHLTR